jgi:hypothetical protein
MYNPSLWVIYKYALLHTHALFGVMGHFMILTSFYLCAHLFSFLSVLSQVALHAQHLLEFVTEILLSAAQQLKSDLLWSF